MPPKQKKTKKAKVINIGAAPLRGPRPSAKRLPSVASRASSVHTTLTELLGCLQASPGSLQLYKTGVPSRSLVKTDSKTADEFELVEDKRVVVSEPEPQPIKLLMRSMFKADHPYRTRLGLSSILNTAASGVLNTSFAVTSISSTQEWASIDALFDEAFVHAMHVRFAPVNRGGGGTTSGAVAGGTPTFALASNSVISCGVQLVSLFGSATAYTTATAMLSNPNIATHMSDAPFKYTWRNNVRFDPRGVALTPSASQGWQGWFPITGSANLGGLIQIRVVDDAVLGNAANAFTLGHAALVYDVSFRSRA